MALLDDKQFTSSLYHYHRADQGEKPCRYTCASGDSRNVLTVCEVYAANPRECPHQHYCTTALSLERTTTDVDTIGDGSSPIDDPSPMVVVYCSRELFRSPNSIDMITVFNCLKNVFAYISRLLYYQSLVNQRKQYSRNHGAFRPHGGGLSGRDTLIDGRVLVMIADERKKCAQQRLVVRSCVYNFLYVIRFAGSDVYHLLQPFRNAEANISLTDDDIQMFIISLAFDIEISNHQHLAEWFSTFFHNFYHLQSLNGNPDGIARLTDLIRDILLMTEKS